MNQRYFELGSKRSDIRELFEYGKKKAEVVGKENVFDFSLGNPSVKPNPIVNQTIQDLIQKEDPTALHGYTSAQGNKECRQAIADDLNQRYGTAYEADHLFLTCGAAASLSISFHALVEDKLDEIIAIVPCFPEYKVFVENSGAKFVPVEADLDSFDINLDYLEKKINPHTKAIIVNSPNNPAGVIYSLKTLEKLAALLNKKQTEFNHPIYLIADEPYRELAYDGRNVPHIPSIYPNTIICYSYSKSLSLPGERIGYILVGPKLDDSQKLYLTICGAARALGYVCAPSLFQKVIERCASYTSNIQEYEANRNLLYEGLKKLGYKMVYPQGAFYLFVKALGGDAIAFSNKAKEYNILIVPSDSFGVKGYVRLSYCVSKKTIEGALPLFKKLKDEYDKR